MTFQGEDADIPGAAIEVWLQGRDFENLMAASQTIGKIMYEQAAAAQGPQAGATASTAGAAEQAADTGAAEEKKDDVIDAEFEVKE